MAEGKILIAATSAVLFGADRTRTWITKGRTTVREGHPILEGREHMFRPLKVDYEIGPEDAGQQTHGDQDDTDPGGEGEQPSGEQDGNADDPEGAEQETAGDAAGKQAAKPPASRKAVTSRSRANG